jgi:hypothetical protein
VEVGVKPRTELRQPVGISVLIHPPEDGRTVTFGFSMELAVHRCNKIDWLSVSSGRDRPNAPRGAGSRSTTTVLVPCS